MIQRSLGSYLRLTNPPRRHGPRSWDPYDVEMWAGVDWMEGVIYVASTDPRWLPGDLTEVLHLKEVDDGTS